jgi:hypothetical protein
MNNSFGVLEVKIALQALGAEGPLIYRMFLVSVYVYY